jgi:hypothetical protein
LDYKRAELVWKQTNCRVFADYLKLYLKTDVLLLADVFENHRRLCLQLYELDPLHFITAPSYSWSACLSGYFDKENINPPPSIECFHNSYCLNQMPMLQMVQKGVRGGISVISRRFAKANNKSSPTMELFYDKNKPTSYILHLDANNLYGYAMSQYLPVGNYRWAYAEISTRMTCNYYYSKESKEDEFNFGIDCMELTDQPTDFDFEDDFDDKMSVLYTRKYNASFIQKWKDNDDTGGILEVDIDFPEDKHNELHDYPPCPETTSFEPSPEMKKLYEFLNGNDNDNKNEDK